ncbi:MAG: sulfurtransferase TusA family protein [Intrasporangiaceae bacterium]|nr:sulfurtransferase TusA family protein [Intrasporangiaceae bacterium]
MDDEGIREEGIREVDARGLACPMPVIELARAIEEVAVGSRVRLLATDPAAEVDVPVWCRMQRHRLHDRGRDDGVAAFVIERRR